MDGLLSAFEPRIPGAHGAKRPIGYLYVQLAHQETADATALMAMRQRFRTWIEVDPIAPHQVMSIKIEFEWVLQQRPTFYTGPQGQTRV